MSPISYCLYLTKLFFTLLVRKNLYLNFFITSFSQYTTICFVSFVYSVFNEQFRVPLYAGGDDGIRTHDPLLAGQVLSQLSYTPIFKVFPTSLWKILQNWTTNLKCVNSTRWHLPSCLLVSILHRKEVIQPHLPIRLPCYDLTPIIEPAFDHCLLAVSTWASGVPNFHGLTGGVYKARERIHRGMLIRDY